MHREEVFRKKVSGEPAERRATAPVPGREAAGGRNRTTALLCILFLSGLLGEARAALEGEAGVEGTWTDNLYLTASSEDDFVTTPFGSVGGSLGEHFGFRYDIDGYLYSTNSELDALRQGVGLRHRSRVGGKLDLEAGLGYGGILHVADSKNLDHHQVEGTVHMDLRPSERMLIVPRIEGLWRTYPNTEDLDYVEAVGSVVANRSFQTQTTLRLTGTLYFRRFLQTLSEDRVIEGADGEADAGVLATADSFGQAAASGSGAGGVGNGAGRLGRGAGEGMGFGSQGPPPAVTIEGNLDSRSAGQFLIAGRLAQSLGSTAGIFVEGTYRTNFLDPPRFAEGTIPSVDREIFDDHYGYEGPGGSMQFSLLLPFSTRLVLSGLIEDRRYVGREALDLDGNPKSEGGEDRRDERYEIGLRGEFSRGFDRAFPTGLSANLGYLRVWNESNDDWYDTRENRFFASVSLQW